MISKQKEKQHTKRVTHLYETFRTIQNAVLQSIKKAKKKAHLAQLDSAAGFLRVVGLGWLHVVQQNLHNQKKKLIQK